MRFSSLFRAGPKETTGRGSKKTKSGATSNVGVPQPPEVQAPWGFAGYYDPNDVRRQILRVANPDFWGEVPSTACFTPVPVPSASQGASLGQPVDRAVEEVQPFSPHYGHATSTMLNEYVVDQDATESLHTQANHSISAADAAPLNPLRANPPTPREGGSHEQRSWFNEEGSDDEDDVEDEDMRQAELAARITGKSSKPFNPVTVEDCPPHAVPPMHGPGSPYFQYAEPDTFRSPSRRSRRRSVTDALLEKVQNFSRKRSTKRRRVHPPNPPSHELDTLHAQILPVENDYEQTGAADADTELGYDSFGHYLDQDELSLGLATTSCHDPSGESQWAHAEHNRQYLVEHGKIVLSSEMVAVLVRSPADMPRRRGLAIGDILSYQHRRFRFGPESGCRWYKYGVIESFYEAESFFEHYLPSLSKFRLTLKHTLFHTDAPTEVLHQTGYFAGRHQKRQEFLRCTHSELTKKTKILEMAKANKYLSDALSDLGKFELDFSSFHLGDKVHNEDT